jgi:HAD superfamily hydrolase (TIGR01549 family)
MTTSSPVQEPPASEGGEANVGARQRFILAICLDFGDTLCDEATEVKDETNTTLRAELIPGAAELLHELRARGYRLALVADGRPGTYTNVLGQHGLLHLFENQTISDIVGVEKPDRRMFVSALDQMGIAAEDYGRVLMVGNNLERDVKGANVAGLISVWLDWAPRRPKVPADASEVPQFTIKQPMDLLGVLDALEAGRHEARESHRVALDPVTKA